MINSNSVKTYKYFWLTIPIIIILALFNPKGTFDLQLHDTYFVTTLKQIALCFSIFLTVIGFIYWLLRDYRFSNWLNILVAVVTICSLIGFTLISAFQLKIVGNNFQLHKTLNSIAWILLITFILSQVLLMINLAIALIRGK